MNKNILIIIISLLTINSILNADSDGLFLIENNSKLNQVLLSSEKNSKVDLIEYDGKSKTVVASLATTQKLHQAIKIKNKIILAFGSSLTKQSEIIRIVETDLNLKNKKELWTKDTGRNQISLLKNMGDSFYLNYFTDTYNNELLKFTTIDKKWENKSIYKKRMSINIDLLNDSELLVGRPYGDAIGENGNAYLVKNGKEEILDTLRGASAVQFLDIDNDKIQELLIADGWHQDYGKIAEARLTLFKYDNKEKKYLPKVILNDTLQFRFETISTYKYKDASYVLAAGNLNLWFFKFLKDGSFTKKLIAKKVDPKDALKGEFLGVKENNLIIAVLNKELSFLKEEL